MITRRIAIYILTVLADADMTLARKQQTGNRKFTFDRDLRLLRRLGVN